MNGFDLKYPRSLTWAFAIMALILAATLVHFSLTAISDNAGFSSNADFYYRTLHPVRHMLISGLFFISLVGTITCAALFVLNWLRRPKINVRND